MKMTMRGVLPVLCLLPLVLSQDRIERVGNQVLRPTATSDWQRTSFLLPQVAQKRGVLFAFVGYFLNQNPVTLQMWRPTNNSNEFTLLKEWVVTPAVEKDRETIYIHTRQGATCLLVEQGDRMGLYFPKSPGAVGYRFNQEAPDLFLYQIPANKGLPAKGDNVSFDSLTYPYDFSAAAFIDTDLSQYSSLGTEPACPTNLQVPDLNIVDPTPTNAPPPTGRPGAPGPPGPHGATGETGMAGQRGNQGERGPMGHTGVAGLNGQMGFTGATGPIGSQGDMGFTGATGPLGPVGATGAEGPEGRQGPAGPPGQNAQAAQGYKMQGTSLDALINPYVLLVVLIWLGLVTVLLIITIVIVTCRRKGYPGHYQRNLANGSAYGTKPRDMSQVNYGGDVYDEPEYSNEGRTAF